MSLRSIALLTAFISIMALLVLLAAISAMLAVVFATNPFAGQYRIPDLDQAIENKICISLPHEQHTGPYDGLRVGFAYSPSGMTAMPAPDYWYNVGKIASGTFDGSGVGAVWVVGIGQEDGNCCLTFPSSKRYQNIAFSSTDENERYLDYFDSKGVSVILQVEPVQADVGDLIHLVLGRYSHHPCVAGVGIDVEWYKAHAYGGGKQVTDEEASRWYSIITSYNPGYSLALTHWDTGKMPPAYRKGLYFLYDGQNSPSFGIMEAGYASWGNAFPDNPVGFYIGFPSDKKQWSTCEDPFYEIASMVLRRVKNTKGIYWVSFSIKDVYPP